MTKILAHVHIYYQEMWAQIKNSLKNITVDYDLYVSIVAENKVLQDDILSFKPQAHIEIVPNKGFDIAPFIHVLDRVNLNEYDYVIKLHTKRNMPIGTLRNGWDMSEGNWRKYLMSYLQDEETFKRFLAAFEKNPKLGMANDFHLICKQTNKNLDAAEKAFELMRNLKINPKNLHYIMGTMFMVRAKLLDPVKQLHLGFDNFSSIIRGEDILPYGLERFFGFIVGAQNYEIKDPLNSKFYQFSARICASIYHFIWRKKECSSGKISYKFCKIPLPAKIVLKLSKPLKK